MGLRRLTRDQARRIAVRAQLLDAPRPTDLVATIEQLTLLQIDPTAAVAPSADLVAWSRLGPSYQPEQLKQAVETDRALFEFNALIRPMTDVGLYLADPDLHPSLQEWMTANKSFQQDIFAVLRDRGPVTSREIPDTCPVPWKSTGWTNNRNVTRMLELLVATGQVAISGRIARERIWDLAENVYPSDLVVPSAAEATRLKNERRLRSLGIARAKGTAVPVEPAIVGEVGEPVEIEDTPGIWQLDPTASADDFTGRTALLSPFDRLIHNRARAVELWDFEYTLEMYKPAAQRRWGYFALPILHGSQLVGKADVKADRKAGVLQVNALHPDVRFTRAITKAVNEELDNLAAWLALPTIERP
ncbi:winged helix-turn-helix domain-containing protein [Kribbella endophytica]